MTRPSFFEGWQSPDVPVGNAALKQWSKEYGVRLQDVIVMSASHDPYVADSGYKARHARWYARLSETFGPFSHLRDGLYKIFGAGQPDPDGRVHSGTTKLWDLFQKSSAFARHTGLADSDELEDRRSSDAVINVQPRECESEPEVYADRPAFMLETLGPLPLFPAQLGWEIPEVAVEGYDYADADQSVLLEAWIEKSTLDHILDPLCRRLGINFHSGPGFKSITHQQHLLARGSQFKAKHVHVLFVSDHDNAGDDMPVAVARTLQFYRDYKYSDLTVTLERVALTAEQVEQFKLPKAPTSNQVEIDALEALHPGVLAKIVTEAAKPWHDGTLAARLEWAELSASGKVSAAWEQETAEIRDRLDEIAGEIDEALAPLHTRYERIDRLYWRLRNEVDQIVQPWAEELERLQQEVESRWQAFEPDLSERPEPTPPPTKDEFTGLFDSRRHWFFEQMPYWQRAREDK